MITNLFSIFDPATTSSVFNTNWISIIIIAFFVPNQYWLAHLPCKINTSLFFREFKPLLPKTPYILIFFLSLFTIIASTNLIRLAPYTFTPMAHFTITLSLAFPAWLVSFWYPFANNTKESLAHLLPKGTPFILIPFMIIIECIRIFIRPITLAIRLAANIIAGHLLMCLLASAKLNNTFLILDQIIGTSFSSLIALETAVALIQAFVFATLLSLYLADS